MLVSIITPCYNAEKTIERCINSVLSSKIPTLEQVIVDGASNDKTVDIIRKLKAKYGDALHYISEKDESMTEALIKAANMAKGQYLAPLNADDFYVSNNLPTVLKALEKDLPDALYTNSIFIKENGTFKYRTRPYYVNLCFMWHLLGCFTPETGVFFSKKLYDKVGRYNVNFKLAQDYDLYLRLVKNGSLIYKNIDLGVFQLSKEQYSFALTDKIREEFERSNVFGKFGGFLQKHRIDKLLRLIFGTQHYGNRIHGDINRFVGKS